jgi:hypothetical protein
MCWTSRRRKVEAVGIAVAGMHLKGAEIFFYSNWVPPPGTIFCASRFVAAAHDDRYWPEATENDVRSNVGYLRDNEFCRS